MPIDTVEIIEAISIIANERNVRVTCSSSAKGAAICAASSFAGGLLLGPLGLAIGGTIGGLSAYKITKGSFRPLGDVLLNDLSDTQKERLVQHVNNAVSQVNPTDLITLLPMLMTSTNLQEVVIKAAMTFVSNELRLQIAD